MERPESEIHDLSSREKFSELVHSSSEDFRKTSLHGKVILGSLLGMTLYEWGPGNEALTPIIAGRAMDVSDGLSGIVTTAAVAGGITMAQQLSSSWLTRKSAQQFPGVSSKMFHIMNADSNEDEDLRFKPFKELPLSKKGVYAFGLGTSFVVARESFVTGSTDEEKLKRTGRISAAIVGATVASVATIVDIIDQAAPDDSWAQRVPDLIKNPILWISIAGGIIGSDMIKSRKNRNRLKKLQVSAERE